MPRSLLQTDDPALFRSEVEVCVGKTLVTRMKTNAQTATRTNLFTYTPGPNETLIAEVRVLNRQIAGTAGTRGNGGGRNAIAVFKSVDGVVTQMESTAYPIDADNNSDLYVEVSTDGTNVNVIVQITGATLSADAEFVWVGYLYLHTVSE